MKHFLSRALRWYCDAAAAIYVRPEEAKHSESVTR